MAQCVPCFLQPRPPRQFRRRAARYNAPSRPATLCSVPPDGGEVGIVVSAVGAAAAIAPRTTASLPYSSLLQSCIDSGSFEEGCAFTGRWSSAASGQMPTCRPRSSCSTLDRGLRLG
ncbi:unnamed protein product [Spirodela intermedia]|uniref:Uncharacterized protein n=1 Tax=Spirodela intermedia TaxID=51605 RepID=A0A7I8J5R4_SPIIN|nr:unnamed protein product [Spirodela intermedia]CAA6664782.1 unnamed protein product [Spirodela intermedia]